MSSGSMDLSQYAELFRSETREHLGAYMNALSDFMGMMLLPSVPSLVVDLSAAVLTTTYLNFGQERDYVFYVGTNFDFQEEGKRLESHFLLLPDIASLNAIFDAIRLT